MKVDILIPVYRNVALTRACVQSVLRHSGEACGRVLLIDDASPEPDMGAALDELARADPRVLLLRNQDNQGFVRTCNRGLAQRQGDVVLLNSDTRVTAGWLDELRAVAHGDERTACASPLSNNATICSVPRFCDGTPEDQVDSAAVGRATQGLPRSTVMPTAVGFCLYLREDALGAVGLLDPAYGHGYNEENDWVMRAQARGLLARRANRALVYHVGAASFHHTREALQRRNGDLLARRYPHYLRQIASFCNGLDAHLAAHAVRAELRGRLRVALDLRHLGPGPVPEAERRLLSQLASCEAVELTVLASQKSLLPALPASVCADRTLPPEIEVVHRPGPPRDDADLAQLLGPAHLVVTHSGDLVPLSSARWARASLAAQAAQAVVVHSGAARDAVVEDCGVPAEEVGVLPPDDLGALLQVYRRVVFQPSPRSLAVRRSLCAAGFDQPPGRRLLSLARRLAGSLAGSDASR